MKAATIAHVSDLHIGKSPATDAAAQALHNALVAHAVDHVVITGDVTHRGRRAELVRFRQIFGPLIHSGKLTVVPGNHDRLGDDVADEVADTGHVAARLSPRVWIKSLPGLRLVCFDSTGPQNRSWLASQGRLTGRDVQEIGAAFDSAGRAGTLCALLLHHHVLPLPADGPAERLPTWLGWRTTGELERGGALLEAISGRCDLVLHGHRHLPARRVLTPEGARPLRVYNAGSSTELGHVRLFSHAAGRLCGPPVWLSAEESTVAPVFHPAASRNRPPATFLALRPGS